MSRQVALVRVPARTDAANHPPVVTMFELRESKRGKYRLAGRGGTKDCREETGMTLLCAAFVDRSRLQLNVVVILAQF